MTIEHSLRRRAARSRWLGIVWMLLTTSLLVITYFTMPRMASSLLISINKIEGPALKVDAVAKEPATEGKKVMVSTHVFTLVTLGLALSAIGFGCYLLSRIALIEVEASARLFGLADALCVAAGEMKYFEQAAALFIPKLGTNEVSAVSPNDLKIMVETLKQLRDIK